VAELQAELDRRGKLRAEWEIACILQYPIDRRKQEACLADKLRIADLRIITGEGWGGDPIDPYTKYGLPRP
jgi:hypothetical protein